MTNERELKWPEVEEACKRIRNEIKIHEALPETSSTKFYEFLEDLKLVLFGYWVTMKELANRDKFLKIAEEKLYEASMKLIKRDEMLKVMEDALRHYTETFTAPSSYSGICEESKWVVKGLSKREWYAGMVVPSMVGWYVNDENRLKLIAQEAVEMADALISELEKTK